MAFRRGGQQRRRVKRAPHGVASGVNPFDAAVANDWPDIIAPPASVDLCELRGNRPNGVARDRLQGTRPLPSQKALRVDKGFGLSIKTLRGEPRFELRAKQSSSVARLGQALRQGEGYERVERAPAQKLDRKSVV